MFDRVFTLGSTRRTVSKYPKLAQDVEWGLISDQRQKQGAPSRAAAEILIKQYMSMIAGLAGKYVGRGIELDELIQLGREGFFYAIERFEEGHNARLSTYATYWIVSFISNRFRTMRKKERQFAMAEEQVLDWIGEYSSAIDTEYISPHAPRAETLCAFREMSERFASKVEHKLLPIERFIICRFSGYKDKEGPATLQSIGDIYNLSRERIRQLKVQALKKLGISEYQLHAIVAAYEVLQAQQ